MVEQVPPDIRFHQNAKGMAVIADHITQSSAERKCRHHDDHDHSKCLPRIGGQQVYMHHREINGNARSIRDMISAQVMSKKKSRRWGLK